MLQIKKKIRSYLVPTGLYGIPETWHSEELGEVIEDLQSGFASGERDDDGILQLRMNNLSDDGRFNFQDTLKVPIPPDIKKFDLRKDDILFNNTNSLDLIGKTVIVDENLDYTFSNHITRLRVKKDKILPYWLYLLFLRYKERFVFKAICHTHVGQSGIGKNELKSLQIFFPSIDEQQKIASILLKVDELIPKTDQIIEQTQRLKKGLMQKLLTKGIGHTEYREVTFYDNKISIPKDWLMIRLSDYTTKIGSGITPLGGSSIYVKQGIPLIRSQNVHFDGLRLDDVAYITQEIHNEMSRTKLKDNDVLLNITGASVGRCTVIPSGFGEGNVNQHVCIIRPKDDLDSFFLSLFLSSKLGQDIIFRSFSGLSREGLNFKEIGSFQILLPPKVEQKKVAEMIFSVNGQIKKETVYKQGVEQLKKGLMQKLLTGKIRVKV